VLSRYFPGGTEDNRNKTGMLCDVTVKRVCVTILAMEKQKVLNIVSALVIRHAYPVFSVPYCHLRGLEL